MKLTPKQEQFCLNIAIKQMSQCDAFLDAGYSGGTVRNTLDCNASQLASSAKVVQRITELRDTAQAPAIADFVERKEILSDIARSKGKNAVHAVDVHNKMEHAYQDESKNVYTALKISIEYKAEPKLIIDVTEG